MARVRADGLGIRFWFDRQGRPATPGIARLRGRVTETWGLRGASVELGPGDAVALIGRNGAGKTTLLRAIAGVYPADEGSVEVTGRVGALLAVNAGLLPPLTGRENALLLAVVAGMSRAEARAALDAIGRRAGLGDAYDRPSSSYSNGMRARLGFAVIEQARPDVLLLDEVYEALDDGFREELADLARAMTGDGGIVIAAGHDLTELKRICDRALVLDGGAVSAEGPLDDVTHDHLTAVATTP